MPYSSRAFLPKTVRIVGFGLLAFGTVTIRSLNGAIDVKPGTGNTLQLTAETRWRRGDPKRDLHFVAEANGNDVLICALWGRGSCSKESYKSGGGNIKVGTAVGPFDAETVNGSAASEFAFASDGDGSKRNHLRGVLGAGGRSVRVSSVNGSAFLRRLNADGTVQDTGKQP